MGGANGESAEGPPVLVFAGRQSVRAELASAAGAAGGRVVVAAPLEELGARVAQQVRASLVLVDVDAAPVPEETLVSAARFANEARARMIVSTGLDALDALDALLDGTGAELQCAPSPEERLGAIGLALASAGSGAAVYDAANEVDAIRLRRLADEVSRIARALARLSEAGAMSSPYLAGTRATVEDMASRFSAEPVDLASAEMPQPEQVRGAIRLRRLRDRFFDAALFADPAWDMLLDLFAARLEGEQVAVSSLCIAAAVPPTTALRWIKAMTDNGMFERHADPTDGRRVFIRLADPASDAMARYFGAATRLPGRPA